MIKQIGKTKNDEFIISLSYDDKIILIGALAMSLGTCENEEARNLLEQLKEITK